MKRSFFLLSLIVVSEALFGAFGATKNQSTSGLQPAAPAVIEPDGTLDQQFTPGTITVGLVLTSALQPDGKTVIGGLFRKVQGVARLGVARLNVDGTLDSTFAPPTGIGFDAEHIAVQTDGKILVSSTLSDSVKLVRLNSNGSLDNSFNPSHTFSLDGNSDGAGNATAPGYVYSFLLQPDGRIVVAGYFSYIITAPGVKVARAAIARFNADGSFDASFNPGAGARSYPDQPGEITFLGQQNLGANAGKIIIGGFFDSFDNQGVWDLARLNPDGSYDETLDQSTAYGGASVDPYSVSGFFVQADDRILVFGTMTSYRGFPCHNIIRLTNDGIADPGFGSQTFFVNYSGTPDIRMIAQQSDGRLIVGGAFHSIGTDVVNNVVRLEMADGTRDASFDPTGPGVSATLVSSILVRPGDDKIFLGGLFSTYGGAVRNSLALANADGTVDLSYGDPGVADDGPEVFALGVQNDGKILVGGTYTSFNGTPHYNLVRLNADSSLDPAFDVDLGTAGAVRAILVRPDGKIVIAGSFTAVNGVFERRIARLNPDGSLDTTFDAGNGADNTIYALAQDSTGNIFAGGAFLSFGSSGSAQRLVKLGPTGAIDSNFVPPSDPFGSPSGPNNTVYAIVGPDSSGRIMIGGNFTKYRSAPVNHIARLDAANGNRDTTFNSGGTGFDGVVRSVLLAPDSSYYVGGRFSTYNGVSRLSVARLNSNGSLDTTFVPAIADSNHYALALQNGKLIVGGDGTPNPPSLVRLTSTGGVDSSFNVGTGVQVSPSTAYASTFNLAEIDALAFQADGNLLIGGRFNKYNGVTRTGLARLTAASAITPTPTPTATPTATPGSVGNVSTRLPVGTGDNALFVGFTVLGPQGSLKKIAVRALGPSLTALGVTDALRDPSLELHDSNATLATNNNWQSTQVGGLITGDQSGEISNSGVAPSDEFESVIIANVTPGTYTAVVRGVANTTGTGLVDAYDLTGLSAARLANVATRGLVQGGDGLMIAGFIVQNAPVRAVVRAIGPSLQQFGINNALADTTLELRNQDGTFVMDNDDWKTNQREELESTGLQPSNDLEAALVATLQPGTYTALVRGKNDTSGIGVAEAYFLQ